VSAAENDDPFAGLEKTLGYSFKNRNLLKTALTAPSYRSEHAAETLRDNQRLEFLGDAVLGLLSAQQMFQRYVDDDEGGLTVRRSHLASGRALARLARRIGLGRYLLLGKGDEAMGGRDADRSLTDAMEAVFGAAWCDGGLAAAQAVYDTLMVQGGDAPLDPWAENPKGRLQEVAQRQAWPDSPAYALTGVSGPDHAPQYTVVARVYGGHEAQGTGRTKRAAEVVAARVLLGRLREAGVMREDAAGVCANARGTEQGGGTAVRNEEPQ
jgi:ribonuclease-3